MAILIVVCEPGQEQKTSSNVEQLLQLLVPSFLNCVMLPFLPRRGEGTSPGYFFLDIVEDPRPIQLARLARGVMEIDRRMVARRSDVDIVSRSIDIREAVVGDLPPGSIIKVVEGPFTGFGGVVDRSDGSKIIIRIQIFGRDTLCEVDALMLEKVKESLNG